MGPPRNTIILYKKHLAEWQTMQWDLEKNECQLFECYNLCFSCPPLHHLPYDRILQGGHTHELLVTYGLDFIVKTFFQNTTVLLCLC